MRNPYWPYDTARQKIEAESAHREAIERVLERLGDSLEVIDHLQGELDDIGKSLTSDVALQLAWKKLAEAETAIGICIGNIKAGSIKVER